MKTVIGFVGMPAAGKSTALEVAQKIAPIVVMGDIIRQEAQKRDLCINSHNLGMVAQQLRQEEGKDTVARRCIEKIQNLPENLIILDGLRSLFEVDLFRSKFNLKIIAIIASDDARHQWLLARGRPDDSHFLQDILNRDQREIDLGILEVIKNADIKIENTKTINDLRNSCQKILEGLIQ